MEYIEKLRQDIVRDLKDLREKIESNEPCPKKPQDVDMLVDISDKIKQCLNNWYKSKPIV